MRPTTPGFQQARTCPNVLPAVVTAVGFEGPADVLADHGSNPTAGPSPTSDLPDSPPAAAAPQIAPALPDAPSGGGGTPSSSDA